MSKPCLALYALGAVVSASAALLTVENRAYGFGLIGAGLAFMIAASWMNGAFRPVTGLAIVIVTNLAFWMSYGLWRMRPQLIGQPSGTGIDSFSLAVSAWLLVFLGCAVYECIVLLRGIGDGAHRQVSAMGLAGVVLQIPLTLRFIYGMIQGV